MREDIVQKLKDAAVEYGIEVHRNGIMDIDAAEDKLFAAIEQCVADLIEQEKVDSVQHSFDGLPARKLEQLLADGWQINGYCIQKPDADGWKYGAITAQGRVLWWHDDTDVIAKRQPTTEAHPVKLEIDGKQLTLGEALDEAIAASLRTGAMRLHTVLIAAQNALLTSPSATKRQPLTADQINQAWAQALNTADPTGGQLPFIFTRCIEDLQKETHE